MAESGVRVGVGGRKGGLCRKEKLNYLTDWTRGDQGMSMQGRLAVAAILPSGARSCAKTYTRDSLTNKLSFNYSLRWNIYQGKSLQEISLLLESYHGDNSPMEKAGSV